MQERDELNEFMTCPWCANYAGGCGMCDGSARISLLAAKRLENMFGTCAPANTRSVALMHIDKIRAFVRSRHGHRQETFYAVG